MATSSHRTSHPRTSAPVSGAAAEDMPDIGDLVQRLRFSPAEGRIWVHNRRSVLISGSAWGSMRREFVDRQGLVAAREAYWRIGYAEGTHDAALAQQLRPAMSYFDAFALGPQAVALAGFSWTEVIRLEGHSEKGTFFGEFLLHDSIEANAHIDTYGSATEPTCWMQSGYASGFASAFAGRTILMREVECRGMGAETCRIIGRPLEEWNAKESDTSLYRLSPMVNRFAADRPEHSEVIGISAGFNTALDLVSKATSAKATLLFLGETGVGKEVFARLAHRMSPRRERPFVAVNCGALPENLVEAELFGVVRGAYTGAHASRPGRFERADGGTLFLDEVSTLSLPAQSKLLRALQEGEIERLGDHSTRRVDVRVMAAANTDLREAMRKGEFREDLYFRLATFPVRIPPLRERRDDIPLLMEYFRKRHCAVHGRQIPGFTVRAVEALLAYAFPGNVRELEHRIERAVLLATETEPIDLSHLFVAEDGPMPAALSLDRHGHLHAGESPKLRRCATDFLTTVDSQGGGFEAIERELLETAVEDAHGNLAAAARRLGLTRRQVAHRLERLRRTGPG